MGAKCFVDSECQHYSIEQYCPHSIKCRNDKIKQLQAELERFKAVLKDATKIHVQISDWNKLQAENEKLKILKEIANKVVLCFPDIIPADQEEVSFNIPAYIIEELKQNLKGD